MSGWEDTLRELRDQFVSTSLRRVDRLQEVTAALRANPSDAALCRELMVLFHGLAGAGTTYGFPEVTRLALLGEKLTGGEPSQAPPDGAALQVLDGVAADLRRELAAGGGGASGAPAVVPSGSPVRLRVLLVEDDAGWRSLLRRRLEQEGYGVVEADSRAAAQNALAGRLPDAIICDEVLPDGRGDQLVADVRRLPGGSAVAILIASVRSGFLDKVGALTSGADGYFEKPVDWEALLRRLQHLLERRLEPPRVLCVEDFEEQAAYLRSVLGAAGYEVQTLGDPRQFEEALAAFRPDLVLMDALLPEISGYELTRYVRQHARFAPLPVLMLTTESQLEGRIEGLKAGCDEYLLKPVAPALLLTAVAAHLERVRLLKGLMERDGLTRLLTRSAFLERSKEAYERARRETELAPFLMRLDLDSFKSVNDRFGYATGDRVLVAFSTLLRRQLRHGDVVGRYGGEEFAILVDSLDETGAERLSTRLCQKLAEMEHPAPGGSSFRVTLSAGMAWLHARAMRFDEWIQAAGDALAEAKAHAGNQARLALNASRRAL